MSSQNCSLAVYSLTDRQSPLPGQFCGQCSECRLRGQLPSRPSPWQVLRLRRVNQSLAFNTKVRLLAGRRETQARRVVRSQWRCQELVLQTPVSARCCASLLLVSLIRAQILDGVGACGPLPPVLPAPDLLTYVPSSQGSQGPELHGLNSATAVGRLMAKSAV